VTTKQRGDTADLTGARQEDQYVSLLRVERRPCHGRDVGLEPRARSPRPVANFHRVRPSLTLHHRGAAQQRRYRLLRHLAGNVPQRDVDRGQRIEDGAGAPEACEAFARREVQRLLLVDQLAEVVRRDRIADGREQRPLHRRSQRQALAVALQAVARRHPRKREAKIAARQRGRNIRRPVRRGDAQGDGFDAVDDHVLLRV